MKSFYGFKAKLGAGLGFFVLAIASSGLSGCSEARPPDEQATEGSQPGANDVGGDIDVVANASVDDGATGAAVNTASARPDGNDIGITSGGPPPLPVPVPPPPQERSFCSILKRDATPSECDSITRQKDALEAGIGVWAPPAEMKRGKSVDVIFALGSTSEEADSTEAAAVTGGRTVRVVTSISRFMTAHLSGSAFKIEPQGSEDRDLGASSNASWTWAVTPTRCGVHPLKLDVTSHAVDANGTRTQIALKTKTSAITVKVDAGCKAADGKQVLDDTGGFLSSLEDWLILLAGVFTAGWLALRAFKGQKPPEKGKDQGKETPPKDEA